MALNEQQKAFVTGTIKSLIEAHKQQLGDEDAVKRHGITRGICKECSQIIIEFQKSSPRIRYADLNDVHDLVPGLYWLDRSWEVGKQNCFVVY